MGVNIITFICATIAIISIIIALIAVKNGVESYNDKQANQYNIIFKTSVIVHAVSLIVMMLLWITQFIVTRNIDDRVWQNQQIDVYSIESSNIITGYTVQYADENNKLCSKVINDVYIENNIDKPYMSHRSCNGTFWSRSKDKYVLYIPNISYLDYTTVLVEN